MKIRSLLTVKFRYKKPDQNKSKLIQHVQQNKANTKSSDDFRFASAIAGYGLLLSKSEKQGHLSFESLTQLIKNSSSGEHKNQREELFKLVEKTADLHRRMQEANLE